MELLYFIIQVSLLEPPGNLPISKIDLNFISFDIKKSFIFFSVLFTFLFNISFFHKLFYDTNLLWQRTKTKM